MPNPVPLRTLQSRCAHSLQTEDHYSLDSKMFLNPWGMFSLDILERMLLCSLSSVKMQIEPTMSICRLHICEFTYLLKCMFNLNSILMWYFCGYLRTHLKGTNFGLPVLKLPTESNQETFCPLASTLLLCKNLFFCGLFGATAFTFFALCQLFHCVKSPWMIVLKYCTGFLKVGMLSGALQRKHIPLIQVSLNRNTQNASLYVN